MHASAYVCTCAWAWRRRDLARPVCMRWCAVRVHAVSLLYPFCAHTESMLRLCCAYASSIPPAVPRLD
eukprot:6185269-Pleurochrysis_carterae.AAC.1